MGPFLLLLVPGFACIPLKLESGDSGGVVDTFLGGETAHTGTLETGTEETGDSAVPCAPEPGVPGQSVSLSTIYEGETRTFHLHLPADYDCTPRPLVIGLHGYYGSGEGFEQNTSEMFQKIEDGGYIGVFPDGLAMGENGWKAYVTSFNDIDSHQSEGPDGPTCTENAYDYSVYDNCPQEESEDACNWGTSCADDEGFLRALFTEVQSSWSVNENRVYLTGFSQGGQTTQSLAWRLADLLTAAAPHHGFAANGYTAAPASPLSLFQVWGVNDRTVDGNDRASNDGMIYDGAEETALVWAQAQGCSETASSYPTAQDGTRDWACIEHANCSSGAAVVSCSWTGAHTWGRTANSDFALDAMWTFFEGVSTASARSGP